MKIIPRNKAGYSFIVTFAAAWSIDNKVVEPDFAIKWGGLKKTIHTKNKGTATDIATFLEKSYALNPRSESFKKQLICYYYVYASTFVY